MGTIITSQEKLAIVPEILPFSNICSDDIDIQVTRDLGA
jgi:hypothetical protein